jgi:predicted amidophosphoribosyltransferase
MLRALADLLLPARCPGCEAAGPGLCPACRDTLEPLVDPCPRCAGPRQGGLCPRCHGEGLAHVAGVRCAWVYAGLLAHLVGEAKAIGRPWAVRTCADLLPVADLDGIDAVVPVPASPGRRPGPHLGSALARRAARAAGAPLRRLLVHTRSAAPQHRLSAAERQENIRGLFRARGPVAGRVLLVDDLLTSGATLRECAGVLRRAGAAEVRALVLARTPEGPSEPRASPRRAPPGAPDGDR